MLHAYIHARAGAGIYIYIYIYTHTHTHTHTHIYIYIYIWINVLLSVMIRVAAVCTSHNSHWQQTSLGFVPCSALGAIFIIMVLLKFQCCSYLISAEMVFLLEL